jgi:hypothetical protein
MGQDEIGQRQLEKERKSDDTERGKINTMKSR